MPPNCLPEEQTTSRDRPPPPATHETGPLGANIKRSPGAAGTLDSYPSFGQEDHAETKQFLRKQIQAYQRKMDAADDLYSDYDYDIGGFGAPANNPFGQPKTPSNLGGRGGISRGPASRLTTTGGTEVRPMTSTTGSGFSSKPPSSLGRPVGFDPLGSGRGPAPPLAKREDNSAEDKAKEYEKQVSDAACVEAAST